MVEAIYAADLAFAGCRFEDGRSAGFPARHPRVDRFLSRLLTPADFGLAAIAMLFVTAAQVL